MKHDWNPKEFATAAQAYLAGEVRVCSNCGKEQTLERTHLWGRVVERRWMPLAGRCKPVKS